MYVLKGVVWKESPNRGNPRSEKSAGKKSNRIKAVWFAWLSKKTKKVVFLQKPRRAWCLRSISLGVAYTSTKEACQLQYEIWNLWESDFFRLTHPCIPAPMTITNEWKSWNQRDQRGGADFLHNPGNLSLKTRPAYIWTKVRGPLDSVMILLSKCRSPKVALVDSWLYMTPLFAGWSAGKTTRQVVFLWPQPCPCPGLPSKPWWGQGKWQWEQKALCGFSWLPSLTSSHSTPLPDPAHPICPFFFFSFLEVFQRQRDHQFTSK